MSYSLTDKKILLIGGAGYIGSVLVRRLLTDGYNVRILDKLLYDNYRSIASLDGNPNYNFISGDFCDKATLEKSLESVTDIVHLAALVGDPICKKYQDETKRINRDGVINLIESIAGRGIDRFIFLSTCSNYGLLPDDLEADENSELNPLSLYAETKVAVEKYLLDDKLSIDFIPIVLRLSTAYGLSNRMRFDLTVSEFTREITLGHKLVVYDEHTWRPYCHVEDISSAIINVLKADKEKVNRNVFNIGGEGSNYTKIQLVNLIRKILGGGDVVYHQGSSDPRNYRVSFEKAKRELRFCPEHTVADAIERLIAAFGNGEFADVDNLNAFYGNYSINS